MTGKVIKPEKLTVLFVSKDDCLKERVFEVLDKDRHHVVVADNCKDALEKLPDSVLRPSFLITISRIRQYRYNAVDKKNSPEVTLNCPFEAISYESEVKIAKLGVHFRLNKPLDQEVTKELFESLERRGEKNN